MNGLICLLLFGSGFSALAYQIVWMREFRLVFGASTAATAAVSALFMAGLGLGGWLLGPRADRHTRPLALYGRLETAIALVAAASPWLLRYARELYLESGGALVLGFWGATGARLALAAIVLGLPTFLMGGTLPAAARAVTAEGDAARRDLGLLYGVNTLGALAGVIATNFLLLEILGARKTLYMAVALNAVVAIAALSLSRRKGEAQPLPVPPAPIAPDGSGRERPAIGQGVALAVAAGTGFAFFLMEIVWYRMLAPVLGGSTYTFGLILAVALGGIGLGGAAYPLVMGKRPATARLLAWTCLLEAVAMLAPYAAGDVVAAIAAQLGPLSALGFAGLIGSWFFIAMAAVFPAAFVSGVQFPLLIALLGRGAHDIGRQTGRAYASNTAGAIAGSLAGGFGLLPWLGAPGCWLLAAGILAGLGLVVAIAFVRRPETTPDERRPFVSGLAAIAILLGLFFFATGPTAAWRHSPVGAGRISAASSRNGILAWMANTRWTNAWDADGVESAVSIQTRSGYSFVINGKSDGNVLGDRGTQIMVGMIGAALHPRPEKAMVVGLGTGCTAGWLSAVEGMRQVDVVELEPAVLHMATLCADANNGVVARAQAGDGVRIIINDAREVLTTIPETYDLVVSEPSNPYRAGIASLFTVEFYREVESRLAPGGLFVSWCQAYEIDARTVATIMATLKSVFPHVECWATQSGDLAFIAGRENIEPDASLLSARLRQPAFADAMRIAWESEGLDGFVARHLADADAIAAIAADHKGPVNTDDLMVVEYDFALTVGRKMNFSVPAFLRTSRARGAALPRWAAERVDAEAVRMHRIRAGLVDAALELDDDLLAPGSRAGIDLLKAWRRGDLAAAGGMKVAAPGRLESLALAESMAEAGDSRALAYLEKFAEWWPASAALVRARLAVRTGDGVAALQAMEEAFAALRRAPWEMQQMVERGFELAEALAGESPEAAARLFEAMREPFALRFLESSRRLRLLRIAGMLGAEREVEVLRDWFEPNPPWRLDVLTARVKCYRATGNPLLGAAERDLRRFGAAVQDPLFGE